MLVSRQAISRRERGSAMPDASNLLQLCKLFGVTTDYLPHDDFRRFGCRDSALNQIYHNLIQLSRIFASDNGHTYLSFDRFSYLSGNLTACTSSLHVFLMIPAPFD